MSVAGVAGPVSSRPPWARALSIGLPALFAVSFIVSFLAPQDWASWRLPAFVGGLGWFAWLLWAWPLLLVGSASVLVRNSFTTWGIPLTEIAEVHGGRRLILALRDGRSIWVVAVSGGGFALEGIRRADAYRQGIHLVRRADDLRLSSGAESRSDASEWADVIRARCAHAVVREGMHVVRRPNLLVLVMSLGAAVALGAIVALPF